MNIIGSSIGAMVNMEGILGATAQFATTSWRAKIAASDEPSGLLSDAADSFSMVITAILTA